MTARGEVRSAEALGRMLQQGRLVSGLTQRELADRLETDQKYIWALESVPKTPKPQEAYVQYKLNMKLMISE